MGVALSDLARHNAARSTNYPTTGEKLAARPVPHRCPAKALTNSLAPGLFEAGEALLRCAGQERVYLVHKVLPSETEDRVVGVPGTSKSAGVTSRDDFVPVAAHERGSVLLPFVQWRRHNFHMGDQQASEPAAALRPNPAVAAAECSCQLLIVAAVAIRSHCYWKPLKTSSKANRSSEPCLLN